jgi:dihydrofolate reductase
MNLIVAVDKNYAIGCENKLLYHIPEDLQYFKQKTEGKVVVMGEKTLFSLPKGRPLPNRRNIVMSLKPLEAHGCEVANSVEELKKLIENELPDNVFVIGGQQIYELLMPYCTYAYITEIDAESCYDKHLQAFRDSTDWKKISEGEWQVGGCGIRFRYTKHKNESTRF